MAWIVPDDLEDALWLAARTVVGDASLAPRALHQAILDRSRRYTSDRDQLSAHRTADLAARAVFFTVADALKVAIPLGELLGRGELPGRRPLRLVDLGAGCGAMALGALVSLAARGALALSGNIGEISNTPALDILAIDRDPPALSIARAAITDLARRRGLALSIATRDDDVTRVKLPPADLITMGTVLNELAPPARLELVQRALAALAPDGALIIVEPALRETSRALHELRDAVISSGTAHVFAPCTRAIAPCPALADPSDWCHEDRALQLPYRTAELARVTHLRDGGMKFSYLVLRKTPLALAEPAASAWRIVSAPMPAKGKLEIIGCNTAGRIPLRLLRRHRTPANRSFESADRGDVVIVSPPTDPDADRLEITADLRLDHRTPSDD